MGRTPVSRLAVLARGEPAMRVVHAVRERNAQATEAGTPATRVIALHTPADRHCLVVREADEAVALAAPDEHGGAPEAADVERALRACGADALWPGAGGVTPALAEVAERLGVTAVGISPAARERLAAVATGRGPVETGGAAGPGAAETGTEADAQADAQADTRADTRADAQADAEAARIAAEKDGRTVEVGVVADARGTVRALGLREVLARHTGAVVLEESACPALAPGGEEALRAEAVALVGEAVRDAAGPGLVGLVDVTFLLDPHTGRAVVRDVGPREPGTHPVTEMVSGVDAAELALHVGTGGALEDEPAPPGAFGYAIEARLDAEDPERGFAAAPGTVLHLGLPGGPGVRIDTGTAEGDAVAAPGTDPLVARIVAWGRHRDEARARLVRALHRTGVIVEDGTTTKGFLLDVLGRPEIVAGRAGTAWLSALSAPGYAPPRRVDVALLAAAIEAHGDHSRRQRERLFRSAERGRPEVGHEVWHQVDLRVLGQTHRIRVARTRPARYRVEPVGRASSAVDVDVEHSGRHERRLTVGGRSFTVLATSRGSEYDIEVDGTVHRVTGGERGLVRAPAPAMVVAVPVAEGDAVAEGDVVAVLESMKLETALRAPRPGVVTEVLVDPNVQVDGGTALVRVDTAEPGAADAGPGASRVDLAALAGEAGAPVSGTDALAALRALVLGFDVDEREVVPLLAALDTAREAGRGEDADALLAGETEVLGIVADLSELSRNRRVAGGASGDTGDAEGGGHNPQEYLHAYLRSRDADAEVLPESFRVRLRRALAHYGVDDLAAAERDREVLDPALHRMFLAHRRAAATHEPVATALLRARLTRPDTVRGRARGAYRRTLGRLVAATQVRYPVLGDIARQTRYRCFDAPLIARVRSLRQSRVRAEIDRLSADPATRAGQIDRIVAAGEPILDVFTHRHHAVMLEVMTRRYYGFVHDLRDVSVTTHGGRPLLRATYTANGRDHLVVATVADRSADGASTLSADLHRLVAGLPEDSDVLIDLYVASQPRADRAEAARRADQDARAERIRAKIGALPPAVTRVSVGVRRADASDIATTWFTFRPGSSDGTSAEDRVLRGLHPEAADRLGLWRLARFDLTRLPAPADVHLFHARGRDVPDDERLVVMADVRDLGIVRDAAGHIVALPQLEHVLDACLDALRSARASDAALARLAWNRVMLHVWSEIDVPLGEFDQVSRALAPRTEALGLEQVVVRFRTGPGSGAPGDWVLRMSRPPGAGLTLRITEPPAHPMGELDAYTQKVIKAQRRGALYPYELIELITRSPDPGGEPGWFTEHDLDEDGEPVPVERPPGANRANIVLGVVTTPTRRYPEGVRRVVLLGDPTRALGAIAEPECRRVLAALDLARRHCAPVEWYAVSAGARIAMDSGTENMDWISRVLRGLITFTQDGGEVNVVVTGINVGAQPYWNAEATMLMHTRGILVMTPDSTMVLTGKQSLDYSGGVSAEDNHGIGGYDRIMGPNGQAQYWAPDLSGALDVLLTHYEHTYTAPGERFPRPAPTTDPDDRDVSGAPHSGEGTDFTTLGEIFDPARNGERKKPFDIRSLLRGVADTDHPSPERWADMAAADSVVVLDAHLGGAPVELIGIESRPLPRRGPTPVDGPAQWTAGTLFPRSSKKTARAINAASGNRPVVVLANLTGFDGSPESLRGLQLEYGAEIGRAVVNFDGPIVFCVVSRYHGGAFVVFSGTLNDNMEIAAVEGSYASVIGGAPAAAVVFAGDVTKRTAADPRIAEAEARIAEAAEAGRDAGELRSRLAALRPVVRSEKLGEVADEFDTRHSVERARQMGSVHAIVQAHRLRPYLVDAVRRGMARTLDAGAQARRTP